MGETGKSDVSGFVPTVGRIVHVVPEGMEDCHAALVSGLDHRPYVVYLRVWDSRGLAEWPDAIRMDSESDKTRMHDPRGCPWQDNLAR
jgi:hypothetical protein